MTEPNDPNIGYKARIAELEAENASLRGNLKGNPVLSTFDGIAKMKARLSRYEVLENAARRYEATGTAEDAGYLSSALIALTPEEEG